MQIKYDIQAEHLDRVMTVLSHSLAEPHLLLGSMGESLLNANQDRHSKGLAPDGTPWKPLSPLTLQTKRSKRILYENGDMLRFHYQVEGQSVVIGTNDWKAIFHHFGTKPYTITPTKAKALHFAGITTKRVNHPGLPARELVGFPSTDRHIVQDVAHDYLTRVLHNARG